LDHHGFELNLAKKSYKFVKYVIVHSIIIY